jgi:hypothetical protein
MSNEERKESNKRNRNALLLDVHNCIHSNNRFYGMILMEKYFCFFFTLKNVSIYWCLVLKYISNCFVKLS